MGSIIEDDAPTTLASGFPQQPDANYDYPSVGSGSPASEYPNTGDAYDQEPNEEPEQKNNLLRYIIIFLIAALLCILAVSAYKLLNKKKTRRIHQTEEVQKPTTEKADSIAAAQTGKKASEADGKKALDANSKKSKSKRHSSSSNLNGGW
jgi:hypothetical protein